MRLSSNVRDFLGKREVQKSCCPNSIPLHYSVRPQC